MERRIGRLLAVREDREQDTQRVGYMARPFILCGLPFKKPNPSTTYYRRQNGDELLEITGIPRSTVCHSEWILKSCLTKFQREYLVSGLSTGIGGHVQISIYSLAWRRRREGV